MAQQLIMCLDGESMKLLGQMEPEVRENYDKLVAELNRRYDPLERAPAYKIEFRSRTHHRHENFMTYAQELKRLGTRAYPDLDIDSLEQFVLDQFIIGLGSLELRRHVQFGHPDNIHQAISLAIEYEAFEMSTNQHDRLRKPKGEVNMVHPYDDDDDDDDEAGAVSQTITARNPADQSDCEEGAVCTLEHQSNKSRGPCSYCHRKNHTVDECFKLQRKRAENPNEGHN